MTDQEAKEAPCMTLESFVNAVNIGVDHERDGQYAFNLLAHVRPELAEQVRGTPLDPFYNDNLLPTFYSWLDAAW
jgi:hypothetical protein